MKAIKNTIQCHTYARGPYPRYPPRLPVSTAHVPWTVAFEAYKPVEFTHERVIQRSADLAAGKDGVCDPIDAATCAGQLHSRVSFETRLWERATGRPLNPCGRTGMSGRGVLWKWGATQAADAMVTRYNPSTRHLEMVSIRRSDTGVWAIPGGMVDPGEEPRETLRREFEEEAVNIPQAQRREATRVLDAVFDEANSHLLYQGYVDDARNTDNAWIETTAVVFHCAFPLSRSIPLVSGSDATAVRWRAMEGEMDSFHVGHRMLVNLAVKYLRNKLKLHE